MSFIIIKDVVADVSINNCYFCNEQLKEKPIYFKTVENYRNVNILKCCNKEKCKDKLLGI